MPRSARSHARKRKPRTPAPLKRKPESQTKPPSSRRRSRRWEFTAMDIRPLHNRVIVQRLEEGEQQIGGIIIPDSAREKPQRGRVIAAGDGTVTEDGKRIPLD